jgi:hypothetical protein
MVKSAARAAGALVLLVGGIAVSGALPASAASTPNTTTASITGGMVENGDSQAEVCLAVNSTGAAGGGDCTDYDNPDLYWSALYVNSDDTVFQIQNTATGQCLSADAQGAVSMASCADTPAQEFNQDGGALLDSEASGLCVNLNETTLALGTATCDLTGAAENQEWFWGPLTEG